MIEFELDEHDYIELHRLLKATGLCDSGGVAKLMIADGLVQVDGKVETRKRCKIRAGQVVDFYDRQIRVV
jgi:ribosome-associated protein